MLLISSSFYAVFPYLLRGATAMGKQSTSIRVRHADVEKGVLSLVKA